MEAYRAKRTIWSLSRGATSEYDTLERARYLAGQPDMISREEATTLALIDIAESLREICDRRD